MANKGRFQEWLEEKKAEEWQEDEFLDFKASEVYVRTNPGKKLYEEFRESLCEAVSAFGNTEGSVVIYGVVAKPRLHKHSGRGVVELSGKQFYLDRRRNVSETSLRTTAQGRTGTSGLAA